MPPTTIGSRAALRDRRRSPRARAARTRATELAVGRAARSPTRWCGTRARSAARRLVRSASATPAYRPASRRRATISPAAALGERERERRLARGRRAEEGDDRVHRYGDGGDGARAAAQRLRRADSMRTCTSVAGLGRPREDHRLVRARACRARRPGSVRDGPSTSTSCTRADERLVARVRRGAGSTSTSRSSRSRLTSSGTCSSMRAGIGAAARRVDERERVVERDLVARPRASRAKSSSVSPGKPTMTSVVSARPGTASRRRSRERDVALARVGAAHRAQDARRARLQRQVHVLADRRALAVRGDHVVAHVLRVRARVADALDAGHGVEQPQQLAEAEPLGDGQVAPPRVDVLAEQRELAHAVAARARSTSATSSVRAAATARGRARTARCSTSRSSCSPARSAARPGTAARGASAGRPRTRRTSRSARAARRRPAWMKSPSREMLPGPKARSTNG